MSQIENLKIEEMIKNGLGYGYTKTRRNPSVKNFIQTTQNGIDFIDLNQTKNQIKNATEFLLSVKNSNKKIIFIGEKPEIKQLIQEIALSIGEPYIVNRFIGGSITNFPQIKKRIEKLHKMLEEKDKGEWIKYTKKEQVILQREIEKLDRNFGGLSSLNNLPGAIVLIDSNYEEIPLKEAVIANIPIVSISNTDCDISKIEYPIIANDSSKSSVEFILNLIKNTLK